VTSGRAVVHGHAIDLERPEQQFLSAQGDGRNFSAQSS
jgi:hypothetical protein